MLRKKNHTEGWSENWKNGLETWNEDMYGKNTNEWTFLKNEAEVQGWIENAFKGRSLKWKKWNLKNECSERCGIMIQKFVDDRRQA